MNKNIFHEMEIEFKKSLDLSGRGEFGSIMNAETFEKGMAFTGFVVALAPTYKQAIQNKNDELVSKIDAAIAQHLLLNDVHKYSDEYYVLSKSAVESYKSLTK